MMNDNPLFELKPQEEKFGYPDNYKLLFGILRI